KVIALRTKNKDFSIQGPLWRVLDYLFVLYGWCFAYLFLFLYRIKCIFFGKEKTSLSQKIYRLLMEILLCIPRMIARIIKKF
ncbi:MAG: hypothetical protein Q8Q33_07530, partial [Chlamydiota bacterium]|nr:hypothetical protein [Chlamydiota bacterium]